MQKPCRQCQTQFEITDEDLAFYDKVSPVFGGKKYLIPPPTLCPDCRQQRRLMFVNDINLFMNKCAATGKEVVSNYHPNSQYKVYDQELWWSDKWDAIEHGRIFDFNRSFFNQLNELSKAVPRPNVFTAYQYDENCTFTNGAGKNKNCYLIFDSDYCQDSYYSYSINNTKNCIDCYRVRKSELCYENTDCKDCYKSRYLTNCVNCNDSAFLDDCYACSNCFMSFNLQHKKYYIYNKPSTKEEYEKFMNMLSNSVNVEKFKLEFEKLKSSYPKKYYHGTQNENITGDYLYNCKNVKNSFDCNEIWDGKYLFQSFGAQIKDSMDFNECGEFAELIYECNVSGYNLNNALFCNYVLDQCSNMLYCMNCHFSSYLFGCIGLQRKKYCILNKQYSKEEYEKLVPKIIEQMEKNKEWGEFFAPVISPFAYNDSLAIDFFPLSQKEAMEHGYKWRDKDQDKRPQTYMAPENIQDVPDSIIKEVLACIKCGSNYKIISQELKFYRDQKMPIPTKCFKCRHYARMHGRNPRKLWQGACAKCQAPIQTTYAPDRLEIVYCEKCYLEAVY